MLGGFNKEKTSLLIKATICIVISTGFGYGIGEYYKTFKLIELSKELKREERYEEALQKLEFAENMWFASVFGMKKSEIEKEIKENNRFIEDRIEYNQGIDEINKGNLEGAKEFFLRISEDSPYYKYAKDKIQEIEQRLREKERAGRVVHKKISQESEKSGTDCWPSVNYPNLYFDGTNWYLDNNCLVSTFPKPAQEKTSKFKDSKQEESQKDEIESEKETKLQDTQSDNIPPEIFNIRVIESGPDTVIIRWTTNEPSISQIRFGVNPRQTEIVYWDSNFVLVHKAVLSGLKIETPYYYEIIAKDKNNNQSTSEIQTFSIQKSVLGVLSIEIDSSTPETSIIILGNKDELLGVWKLTSDPVDDITITQIIVYNKNPAGSVNVRDLKLYCGGEKFGETIEKLTENSGIFNGNCVISAGSSKQLLLKADITPYEKGAKPGEYVQFYITLPDLIRGDKNDSIIAYSSGGYSLTNNPGEKIVNPLYPYRDKLTVHEVSCHNDCACRRRGVYNRIADFIFSSVTETGVFINSITINITGDLNSISASGTPFYLKTKDGIEKAVGYFSGDSSGGSVTLFSKGNFWIGKEKTTYELVTNTFTLLEDYPTDNETLNLSLSFGTPFEKGDIAWSDQGSDSPITWIDGMGPISLVLTYY